jgi:serine protease AprX
VIDDVVITQLKPNSPGDGRGHGTFVAGIAAGSAKDQAGAAPQANLVSLDVMDDSGMARTSDVIAAAQWIYDKRLEKNIKVANFSLHATTPSNFINDPLDKAVEKLWFGGVTVVVAAGNYGTENGPSGIPFAPGNDPFVITVGAVDLEGSVLVRRHDVPNWSAYGYTKDGFRKPELAAAGRYMIGPVPAAATLRTAKPENVVGSGYMRLSGTSFSAPVVAGAAALLHMEHPTWTPDQIKGALMQRARYIPDAPSGSAGVGDGVRWVRLVCGRQGERLLGFGLLERCLLVGRVLVGRVLVRCVLERCLLVGRLLERRPRSGGRELGGQRRGRGRESGGRLPHDSGG